MFRPLKRIKQQLSEDECKEILLNEPRGVLSVIGDDNYPYALPINFYYDATENKIYFHTGKEGHKLDSIKKNNKVSFCVYDKGFHKDNHWSLNIKSVIVFGKISITENWSRDMMVSFCKRFTDDIEYINSEIDKFQKNTIVMCLEIEHMTGKLVNEA